MLLALLALITLPPPSGKLATGERVLIVSPQRKRDRLHQELARKIIVHCWYPSKRGGTSPYISEPSLLSHLSKISYYNQNPATFENWTMLRNHSGWNAPLRPGRWPVVLFMPGLGTAIENYTLECEDLASRGFYVAALDPPYGGYSIAPGGRLMAADDDPNSGDPAHLADNVKRWAEDARDVLDGLDKKQLDLTKIAAIGHSQGGTAAIELAMKDPRIRASVDLDGAPVGGMLTRGAACPTLVLRSDPNYSDGDLARLGRTRESWNRMVERGRRTWNAFLSASGDKAISLPIRDTGHLSYSDAPYVMPDTVTRFSNHSLTPDATLQIERELVVAFVAHYLQGREWNLSRLRKRFPQVE